MWHVWSQETKTLEYHTESCASVCQSMTFCWSLSAFTPWKQIAWDLAVDRNWHMVQMVQSGHKGYDKEPPMPGSHPSCHLPLMQGIQEMGSARLVKFGIAAQLTKCRNALCGHWSHVGSCESIPLEPAVGAPHASAPSAPHAKLWKSSTANASTIKLLGRHEQPNDWWMQQRGTFKDAQGLSRLYI